MRQKTQDLCALHTLWCVDSMGCRAEMAKAGVERGKPEQPSFLDVEIPREVGCSGFSEVSPHVSNGSMTISLSLYLLPLPLPLCYTNKPTALLRHAPSLIKSLRMFHLTS